MSLMNYGFTKSKIDRKDGDESHISDIQRQEAEMVSCVKKSLEKPQTKSPTKSTGKQDKGKKESKSPSTKSVNPDFTNKKPSPNKLNKKVTPTKSSPQGSSKSKSPKDSQSKSPQDLAMSKIKAGDILPVSKKLLSEPSGLSLPYQRIKMIMKSCPDVEIVPQESLHIITKATELFIQHLALQSIESSEKNMLDYEALSKLVHSDGSLEFLKETIPQKITWAECQKLILSNAERRDDFI